MKFLQTLTIEVPRFRGGNAACGVIWSMLLGVAFLYAAGTGLKFPFWYHWDEESKAVQLTEGGRDLYHPLLLVNTADAVAHLVRPHQGSLQHATETGRMVAAFMAASIAALALAAWVTAGPMSGVLAGVFLFLHPLLFRYAHFFKEDPALILGWSLLALAVVLVHRRPGVWSALAVGATSAMTVSGKYIGIVPALIALVGVSLLPVPKGGRRTMLGALWASFVFVFGLINYQLVIDSGTAASRIAWELDHQFNNQTGGLPAWRQVGEDLGWFGAVFLLVGLCRWFVPGSRDVRAEKIIVLSGWVYFLCLFLIQRQVERYALPVHLIAWWMIGVGLGWSLTLLFRKGNGAGLAGLALICGIISVRAPAWTDAVNAFDGPDTRMQMARYIRDHAWTEGQVMADIYSGIPDCHNPQRSIDGAPVTVPITRILQWEPGFGESMYDTLVAQGYRLVAILPSYRERYANPDLKGGFGQFRDLEQRRDFYRRVMTEGELVHIEYGDGSYLSPTLELYRFGETPPLPPPAQ